VITSDRIREGLTQMILSGELRPGDILREGKLAESFGTSRTPVREAIRQVAATGLITLRPHQRSIVATLGLSESLQRFETMGMLEAACAELCAIRRNEGDLETVLSLHALCERHEQEGDTAAYFEANEDFHAAIYHASGNAHLAAQTLELRQSMQILRAPRPSQPLRRRDSFVEHARIVEAISKRDPAAARVAMRDHVAMQGEALREFVEHHERLTRRASEVS
jgi:DNA-binding GntR family transcriptional regulator